MRATTIALSVAFFSICVTQKAGLAVEMKPELSKCKITFVGGKPDGSTHEGGFKKFDIQATADFETPNNSTMRIEIDTDSLWADNDKLAGHLKNPDFFDVRKYPKAIFELKSVDSDGKKKANMVGTLTLLGKTAPLTVPVAIEHFERETQITGKFKLDRTKWGMNYGMEGNKINKEVEVSIDFLFKHEPN
jgi:polyisoprenoid-binding protein YceI